ncbi:MAG: site-2 protease family protein [Actinomycetota bacterium]
MFGNSWRVGRIFGIDIRIDTSWVFIVLLIGYSLYLQFLRDMPRDPGLAAGLAGAATVMFFGSVLLHELAHSLMSVSRGIPVKGITLFLFGGATHAKLETRKPRDEFVITIVGPLTSLVLGGILWAVALATRGVVPEAVSVGLFGRLGFINVALGVFNLLPGFPLDGGRILRSAVWGATGSLSRATRVAARFGQAIGYLLVGAGIGMVLFLGGLGGLWIAAIGWFLAQAALASAREQQVRRMLEDAEADDVMARNLISVPGRLTLQEAVDEYFMRHDHGAFPVEDDGRTVGLLTLRRVRKVPREDWPTTRVRDAMASLEESVTVSPQTPMPAVLDKLEPEEVHRVLVVDDGELAGIITPLDVARWLRRRQELA